MTSLPPSGDELECGHSHGQELGSLAPDGAAAPGSAPVPAIQTSPAWTAGPWTVHYTGQSGELGIRHADTSAGAITAVLAVVRARATWRAEGQANARLIAAAPCMAVAIAEFIADEDALIADLRAKGDDPANYGFPFPAVDKMRAALALARGEDQ